MKRVMASALAAALIVGGASAAFPQAGTGTAPRTESARAADRRDDGFNWGWLGLLGLGGLAGLMGRDRRRTGTDYTTTTTADRTGTPGSTTGRSF